MRKPLLILAATLLTACTSRPSPIGESSLLVDPTVLSADRRDDDVYRIGVGDKLAVTVFQVPDLSFEEVVVDSSGNLLFPLIGSVKAAGRTAPELSGDIQSLLADRYLRDPQVAVAVSDAASHKVTVDGAVTKPGVYEMKGRVTLLQAVAMAEGPTRTANLESVAVFRNEDGRRMAAVFDLDMIRSGQSEDPVLRGDDIVVVDTSRLNAALREVIAALPGVAAFAYF